MPARKKPEDNREFKVGDTVLIQQDDETRLIVDYGFDETATVSLWQVRRE